MLTPRSNWNPLFEKLRDSRWQIALVVTGGGAGALGYCFSREGASRIFIEAVIPYSHAATTDYLGGLSPDSSASGPAAKQLAAVAFERAGRLIDEPTDSDETVGIALVAALPTTPKRRGPDRIHVAIHNRQWGMLSSIELADDAYTRSESELIADEMIRRALSELVESEPSESFFRDAKLNLETTRFEI